MKKPLVLALLILGVFACRKASLLQDLKVYGGTGSGSFEIGSKVPIMAFEADSGSVFSHWIGDTIFLENPGSASTNCNISRNNVSVRAIYKSAPYFTLSVNKGTGSGQYQEGQLLEIVADSAQGDSAFYQWTGNVEYLEQLRAPITTLQMPAHNIVVEAKFAALPKYRLEVIDGSGDGHYLAGTQVRISPNVPVDLYFKAWSGDIQHLNDHLLAEADITMPGQDVLLQANFENAISFSSQVSPLISSYCATAGCHDANSPNEPLTNYGEIKHWAKDIRDRIFYGNMPPGQPFNEQYKQIIIKWVNQGAQNN